MLQISEELKKKLLAAGSEQELKEMLEASGAEATAEQTAWLFKELTDEKEGKELSLDELEAVSGGLRNWWTEGCYATVEYYSHCEWSVDNCVYIYHCYHNAPIKRCSCGGDIGRVNDNFNRDRWGYEYRCKSCGHTEWINI